MVLSYIYKLAFFVFGITLRKPRTFLPDPKKHSGGRNRDNKAVTIGKMTNLGLEWSKGPDLLLGRYYHRSILIGNVIYHVGGNGNK